jgi:hypothetical protein
MGTDKFSQVESIERQNAPELSLPVLERIVSPHKKSYTGRKQHKK